MALSPVRPRASMSAGSADTIAFTRSYSPALIASMNAASLSGMGKLYLADAPRDGFARLRILRDFVMTWSVALAIPAAAAAQTTDHVERPPLGSTLTLEALSDLPSGGNLFTLLDTAIPEVITDRVD